MAVQVISLPLSELANGWKLALEAQDKSPKTLEAYLGSLQQLDRFLAAKGMPRGVARIRREHIEALSPTC